MAPQRDAGGIASLRPVPIHRGVSWAPRRVSIRPARPRRRGVPSGGMVRRVVLVAVIVVAVAKDIASRASRPSRRGFAVKLHDVLIQFDEQTTPPTFLLFAVIVNGTDKEVARQWLTGVGMAVPDRLGVLGGVDAGYRSETSLELIESAYSADLSGLSWPGPDPL